MVFIGFFSNIDYFGKVYGLMISYRIFFSFEVVCFYLWYLFNFLFWIMIKFVDVVSVFEVVCKRVVDVFSFVVIFFRINVRFFEFFLLKEKFFLNILVIFSFMIMLLLVCD